MFGYSNIFLEGKKYKFGETYYHWGTSSSDGSEHSIDGQRFAGELQYLFYKEQHECIKEASRYDGGMAVVAFVFEVSSNNLTVFTAPYHQFLTDYTGE